VIRTGEADVYPKSLRQAFVRGEWLRRLCEHLYRNNEATGEASVWLAEKKACLADAGDEPVCGSDNADYRLNYAAGLFDPGMK
jgi:dsDNA-binding SOS-regulon protein